MNQIRIAWYGLHEGEEPPLSPAGGIFFSGCNLHCIFCQNYQISQKNLGKLYTTKELADIMVKLQNDGAKNIDLVTPTIWHEQIKGAILSAKEKGLKIPIIWNSNAYEDIKIIKNMKGLINIYLPDFKYSDDELALKYSGIKNYVITATKAIEEMLKQTGHLQIKNNTAHGGVIVRHLVLPNNLENSFGVLKIISEIDSDVHISLMNQYFPMQKAHNFPELNRTLTQKEFQKVYDYLLDLKFRHGWVQGEKSQQNLIPDFTKASPFN